MKNLLTSSINKVLIAIIALLGFSCRPDDIKMEYGMPTADFKVYGSISDETTLRNLNNIEVVMNNDTVYSDVDGNYEVVVRELPSSQVYTVTFKDIDGTQNGVFLPTDSVVDFSDEEFTNGDGSWYSGEKSKEINIKLSSED